MELKDAVRYFVEEDGALECMSIACGTKEQVWCAQENVSPDAVFDLASLSKLFTGLTAMRLWERGQLDLGAPVTRYEPRLRNLSEVTVAQVLGFELALRTDVRLDQLPDRESALAAFFDMKPFPNGDGKAYSDMHAMVISFILAGAAGFSAMECVRRELLEPLGMKETWCRVPAEQLHRCLCYDHEHRIEGGRWIVREGIVPGRCHDPKATALSPDGDAFCGHAGLFSTRSDLIRLCQGILRGEVLQPETLREMARNRTGRRLEDDRWTQFLGCLCYVRHPVQYFSEVPVYMGDQALALSGFTGNHLAIDPERGIFEFYLGNRVHNRLTMLIPEKGKNWTDYGLEADGRGSIEWPGEGRIQSSVDFVHRKDRHYHPAIAHTLGLEAR